MGNKTLGIIAGALLGAGIVTGMALLGGESDALPSDQKAAWAVVNDETLPALSAEQDAGGEVARLTAEVAATEARLADLRAALVAARKAETDARKVAKDARTKLGTMTATLASMPASLRQSGQLVAVEKLKPEPAAPVEEVKP